MNPLSKEQLVQTHYLMSLSRLLDEKLIQIYKKGQGYFWIGSPGEEAFLVALGQLVKKGQGLNFDWLYLHYRCTGTVIAMGLETKNAFRLMMSKKTDPFTGGKNFVHHYCIPEWNIPPITSVIEMQHSIAIGTAHAQASNKASGITIVTGGDSGTALADFFTSLLWSSRPKNPLPLLIIVSNNHWGISTSYQSQHGQRSAVKIAEAFGIQNYKVDGNDFIKSYKTLKESLQYVRENKKPALVEADVSRLYGHSSASGMEYAKDEVCCLKKFESYLIKNKILDESKIKKTYQKIQQKLQKESQEVLLEEDPSKDKAWSHIYFQNEEADWRNF